MVSTIYGGIIDPHRDQLPIGLVAQLAKYCNGIAEARAQVKFFRPFYCYCKDH